MTVTVKRGTNRPSALARTERAAQRTELPPRRMGTLAAEAAGAPDRSVAKAQRLQADLAALDWRVKVVSEPGRAVLIAKRDKHILTVVWVDGCYRYTESHHTRPDGLQVKVLNVSAFKRLAAMS